MPQMSPIYWVLISMFCYLNFMMMLIMLNSFFINIDLKSKEINLKFWKWLW